MRRILGAVAAAAIFSFLAAVYTDMAIARLGDPQPAADRPDTWSVGRASAEVTVDFDGNFIPGVDNDVTLGSATHRWRDIRSLNMTLGDALVVNGNTTLGDASSDTLDINVTTITINATIHGIKIGTSTTDSTYLLTIDGGTNRRVGIGDDTPDGTLEVVSNRNDQYSLLVSSVNGTTNILAVDGTEDEVELGVPLFIYQRTKAQLQALSPRKAGLMFMCTDCTRTYTVCNSTGTGVQQLREQGTAAGPCE